MKEAEEAKEKTPDKYKHSRNVDWGYKGMYLGTPSEFTTKPARAKGSANSIDDADTEFLDEFEKMLEGGQLDMFDDDSFLKVSPYDNHSEHIEAHMMLFYANPTEEEAAMIIRHIYEHQKYLLRESEK